MRAQTNRRLAALERRRAQEPPPPGHTISADEAEEIAGILEELGCLDVVIANRLAEEKQA